MGSHHLWGLVSMTMLLCSLKCQKPLVGLLVLLVFLQIKSSLQKVEKKKIVNLSKIWIYEKCHLTLTSKMAQYFQTCNKGSCWQFDQTSYSCNKDKTSKYNIYLYIFYQIFKRHMIKMYLYFHTTLFKLSEKPK